MKAELGEGWRIFRVDMGRLYDPIPISSSPYCINCWTDVIMNNYCHDCYIYEETKDAYNFYAHKWKCGYNVVVKKVKWKYLIGRRKIWMPDLVRLCFANVVTAQQIFIEEEEEK